MPLVIDDPDIDRLAQELADATGVSVEEAVRDALTSKHAECVKTAPKTQEIDWAEVDRILDRVAQLPVLDARSPDEIIGYDEHGLP